MYTTDVFLCHASEDKSAVVLPLAAALAEHRISYWLDKAQINWGDSIVDRINEGLRDSRFVIVIFSRAFLTKNWPKQELKAVLSKQAQSGQVRVLPIVVGAHTEIQTYLDEFPLLADKLFMVWEGQSRDLASRLRQLLDGKPAPEKDSPEMHYCGKCKSPFEHGMHICLGCKRNIVYGLTAEERLQARQGGFFGTAVILISILILIPSVLSQQFGLHVPIFLGLNFFVGFALSAATSLMGGFKWEQHQIARNAGLIRTF